MKHLNVIEDVLIGAGVGVALIDIQTILGIILLAVQLSLLLFKLITKILNGIKNKDSKEIETALKDAEEEIKSLSDKNKDGK